MLIDWISVTMPLAATDDANFFSSLMQNVVLWGRVALGIGLVIFVHELGHFVAAKTFGVKCEKFYVGFDVPIRIGPIKFPRTLGKFRYGETEYGIGVIPLGGYVKMLGQDDDPRKQEEEAQRIRVDDESSDDSETPPEFDPRSFPAKPVWQRMIIISAGVVMNVITGVLFAAIAFGYGVAYSPAYIGGVVPGGPAWQAGIEPGGKVVKVGTYEDHDMHFREMKIEILTEGLTNPDKPIGLALQYDDGIRKFQLQSQSLPKKKDAKMIGIAIPSSLTLGRGAYADPESVASEVLGQADGGAEVIGFDGVAVKPESIIPGAPFFHHLYSNPTKTVQLDLRRADGSTYQVALPPQKSKSIGIQFAVGPVVALVEGGPSAKAGMKIGDVVRRVGDDESPDAYGLAIALVDAKQPVTIAVERGEGTESQIVELEITPSRSLQTIPPTQSISGEIAVNSVGFAYQPLSTVASVVEATAPDSDSDATDGDDQLDVLRPGDQIEEIRLVVDEDDRPEWLADKRYSQVFEQLEKGWEFTAITPLNTFRETIQRLPVGTELIVLATRPPQDRVVKARVVVQADDQVMFERGLVFEPRESIQKAESFSEALALGTREGYRQFSNVLRFLRMIPTGSIKLRHVGGPLEIVNIAKHEAEKGISRQLMFLTMLSMNLAILNFLPIPALDGGHMMFLLYEFVAGKRANEQLEFRLTVAGLLTLLMLMAVVFANDILRHL